MLSIGHIRTEISNVSSKLATCNSTGSLPIKKILSASRLLRTTKVIPLVHGATELVMVGITRERFFGPDSIEEALKVVDTLSSGNRHEQSKLKVLVGINDQEFLLITKSVGGRNSVKGRFMSPLVVLCRQYSIPISSISRNLAATSSKLSNVSLFNPFEFYKLLWIIGSKSLSLIRTPQARPYLSKQIPAYVSSYIREGSYCMTLKILHESRKDNISKLVAVVPLENLSDIVSMLETKILSDLTDTEVQSKISELDTDAVGLWVPVFLCYVVLPIVFLYETIRIGLRGELGELSNYETQGIALGTWVRDKRRD